MLAELMVLAPNGVEEEQGPGYVEYAIYGGEGELPELGEIEAAAGEGLVEVVSTEVPDDWADRWQDFHRPILVGDRLWLRPSWEEAREGTIDVVVDPGRAFGTGAHPTTRLCLELLLELAADGEAEGPLTDLGTGSGLLAIAAAKLGWSPVSGYDHEQPSIEAATTNAAANRRRDHPRAPQPPRGPAAARPDHRRQPHRLRPADGLVGPEPPAVAEGPSPLPKPLVCSGLLPAGAGRDRRSVRRGRPGRGRPPPRRRLGRPPAPSPLAGMFSAMVLATYGDSGYKIGLFLHILAVVLAFGPTFGYALFFSVVPQYPRATPAILAGVQKCDRYLVNPGMVVLLLAGLYLLSAGDWDAGKAFIVVGFVAIIALFGLQHGFFQPQVRRAKDLAERDLKSGDELSDEFLAVSDRIGKVGTLAGVIVVVTVFFMTYKPFL